jgi:hypothetical protein
MHSEETITIRILKNIRSQSVSTVSKSNIPSDFPLIDGDFTLEGFSMDNPQENVYITDVFCMNAFKTCTSIVFTPHFSPPISTPTMLVSVQRFQPLHVIEDDLSQHPCAQFGIFNAITSRKMMRALNAPVKVASQIVNCDN